MVSDEFTKDLGLESQSIGEVTDDTAASIIELSGVIKWFDVSKGFGFIVPDNGMPDILLHVTCLRRDGFQTAYEGARVVAEVLQRPKGLQCFRVLSMDESTAIHPSTLPPVRTHVTVTPTSGLERAQVKWFNRLRGFGFVTRGEGTPDIFSIWKRSAATASRNCAPARRCWSASAMGRRD
jgi:CspA family cold shock protein